MADFYLSPEDVQLIDEAVFRLFGRNLSNAGRIALENITDNQNQALTLATEANARLDVLEPRVSGTESSIVELQNVDAATEIRMDALEAADNGFDARIFSLESERIGTPQFTEGVQDVVGSCVVGSGSINVSYDDPSGLTTLSFSGVVSGFAAAITTKSANYTLTSSDFTILCDGTFTATLPAASAHAGRIFNLRNITAGTVTIARTGSDTINGGTSFSLIDNEFVSLQSDGVSSWWIIGYITAV